jgi:hypothetical protein
LIIIKEDDLINMTHSPKDLFEPIWPAKPPGQLASKQLVTKCMAIGVKPTAAKGEV